MHKKHFGLGLVLAALVFTAAVPPASLPRAIAAQEALLAADPGDAQATNDYGNLLLLAGREGEAEQAYHRAVELAPDLHSARFNLALLLEQRGALQPALEQLRIVVEAVPAHAWAHFQLGRIAERQGRERAAVASYAAAFSLDPALSFPEVNPQVIDSELVTRALLATRPDARVASEAPRMYEQPGRIATLLLPALPTQAADAPEAPPAATEEVVADPGAMEMSAPIEEGPRILKPEDLPTGSSVGEATPATTPQARPRARAGSRAWSAQQRQRLQRQTPATTPGATTPDEGYRPGAPSTGQSRLRVRDDG